MLPRMMMCSPRQCRSSSAAIAACLTSLFLSGCGNSASRGNDHDGLTNGAAGVAGAAGTAGQLGSSAGAGAAAVPNGVAGGGTGGIASAGVSGAPGASGTVGIGGSGDSAGVGGSGAGSAGIGGSAGDAGLGGSAGIGGSAGGNVGGSAGSAGASGGAGGALSTCPAAKPSTGGKQYCSNSKGSIAGGGYAYELWAEGPGSGCMTVFGSAATFKANWSNVEDFLARAGLDFDQTKTPAQIGTISADFAETKTGNNGLVYVGIYGWTVNPLREYYILDDWGDTKPAGVASDGTPRDRVGTITVDGAVYDVWKKTRTNKPAITGDNKTFDQYFSIRQTARQCGHVSISEHFSKWVGLGLQLGNLYEAKILLEAQASTGTVEFTTATVTVTK